MENRLVNVRTPFVRTLQFIAMALLVALTGCVQKTPVPYYARAGDTIVLGLGGIQRNTKGATNLQASDLAITITNTSTSAVTPLTPSITFKAFPDYSSGVTAQVLNGTGSLASLVLFDGGWFVTTTLPNDGSLAPGSYTISITSPKLTNIKFNNGYYAEGDLTQIPLQVVAGTGGNSDYDSQFNYYPTVSNGRLDVSPNPTPVAGTAVGGLQLVITFPTANYSSTRPPVVALPYSHNPSIQLAQNIVNNGDGTSSLVVLLSSSQGFLTGAGRTMMMPRLSDLSLSFLFQVNGVPTSAAQQLGDFKIDPSRSHYYDTSGNVIATLTPTMTFQ